MKTEISFLIALQVLIRNERLLQRMALPSLTRDLGHVTQLSQLEDGGGRYRTFLVHPIGYENAVGNL